MTRAVVIWADQMTSHLVIWSVAHRQVLLEGVSGLADMGSAGKEVLTGKEGLDSRIRGNDKQVVVPAKAGTFRVRPGPTDVHD